MKADEDVAISLPMTMMLTLPIVGAPYVVRWMMMSSSMEMEDTEMAEPSMFQNDWQWKTELVMIIPLFLQTMLNLLLFQTMKVFLKRRSLMKQMMMCLLEPELADTYQLEALPALELDAENLAKFFKLYKFIRTYQRKFFMRSSIYNTLLGAFYLMQTLYLWATVLIGGAEITPNMYEFCIVAFMQTTVVVYLINLGIIYGSEAN